ncbi:MULTISPECIES: helix-turn-helix domain-containing protein [Bacillaceae]|uniref:Helix-turn-helix domain-containing protein n=2 Tax=Metabacillus hrfriensis TaxID=3048891 RepID=A0ACD4RG83_9BACI|nr:MULTISPECIES: helix-turn-helix domain-containing protein [Bacillaceae]UOK59073.1 helix-turn-helix domain containing protein [Bacillus sp. OVS6]USK29943.1 helix-turn-helix domain containing protein [Bacillus sp. CMF21]USK36442.1 helix-turn-helix domain containing protein [Bacillus sp. F19]MDQ0862411.1 transposase [Bacillus sp. V2I10]UAL53633.1 helix-turn-helix domain containing protein [Metabacillus dongyingensis]
MGKIRKTYTKEIKLKAINLYINDMGIRSISKELGIGYTTIQRWISHYKSEGVQGLEEKRGTSRSQFKGRPNKDYESEAEKINRLEAENAFLKKLLAAKRGMLKEKKNR